MPKVGKNISLKFYAKQNLKPIPMETMDGKPVDGYPLYASVYYGAESTSVKVQDQNGQDIYVSKDLAQLEEPHFKPYADQYSILMRDLVAKEAKLIGKQYKLAGIGARRMKYGHSLYLEIMNISIQDFWGAINPESGFVSTVKLDDKKILSENFQAVYECIQGLADGRMIFFQTSIYEWFYDDAQRKMKKKFNENLLTKNNRIVEDNKKIVNSLIKIIDAILLKKMFPHLV